MGQDQQEQTLARQGRVVALVIAGAMMFWILAQWIGPQIGLAGRYAILIDLAVLAALLWAIIVTLQIWQKRRTMKG